MPATACDDIVFDDKESSATAVQKALAATSRRGTPEGQAALAAARPAATPAGALRYDRRFRRQGHRGCVVQRVQGPRRGVAARSPSLSSCWTCGWHSAIRRLGRLRLRSDPVNQDPWHALAPDPPWTVMSRQPRPSTETAKPIKRYPRPVGSERRRQLGGRRGALPGRDPPGGGCNTPPRLRSKGFGALMMVVNVAVGAKAEASQFPDDWLFHCRWGKGKNGTKVPVRAAADHLHHGRWAYVGGRRLTAAQGREGEGDEQQAAAAAASEAPARAKDKKKGQASSQSTSEPESTTLAEPKKQPRAAPVPSESKGRKRARSAEAHNMEEEAAVSRAPRQSRRTRPLA